MEDRKMNIQWFPGHMAKAQREISEHMRFVDVVCEIIDARIPRSSRNPDIAKLSGEKPRLVILNRADLADPSVTKLWSAYFKEQGTPVLETDCKSGRGVSEFSTAARAVLAQKLSDRAAKGQASRPIRAMVLGVPNVGKSTFINKAAKRKAAKASDRPGVTRGRQWVTVDAGMELLDTPGILWPKLDSPEIGLVLAFTGAIRDATLDIEELGARLMLRLAEDYPQGVESRYGIESKPGGEIEYGVELLEMAAKRRGFLVRGGEPDIERMATIFLDEFRDGRLGRISLEKPEVID